MAYKLFLDDERLPPGNSLGWGDYNPQDWVVVRSYAEAIEIIETLGAPDYVSFDHDLGSDKTGKDFADWLIEKDLDNPGFLPGDFEFYVHSQNPIGKKNIESVLNSYLNSRRVG